MKRNCRLLCCAEHPPFGRLFKTVHLKPCLGSTHNIKFVFRHSNTWGSREKNFPLCPRVAQVCVCVWVCGAIVQAVRSCKGIMKICVPSMTVGQCSSLEYYDCHYQIAKPTGHVTHQPPQTAQSKQRFILRLTTHHCPSGGIWAAANGLPLSMKGLSQI